MIPKLIGLTGYTQTGKSTVAEYLDSRYNYERTAFASRLKAMLGLGLGLTLAELYGHAKDIPCDRLLGVTPRHAMQTLGTEWGRNMIHPDLWCSLTLEQIKHENLPLVVIEDVRFPNEAELIHKAGGVVIRIMRGNPTAHTHTSETSIDQIKPDLYLDNHTGIGNLYVNIDTLMKGFSNV